MPSRISKLISRIGRRSPSGPKKKELSKSKRRSFPITPLSSRRKRGPFNGDPGSRRRSKSSSSSRVIRLRVISVRNIRGSKVKAFDVVGRKALFLRCIKLPFSMVPQGKKSTSPRLNFMPLCFSIVGKHVRVEKASP